MSQTLSDEKEQSLGWRRSHPLSPLTQMWMFIALAVWNIGTSMFNNWGELEGDFFSKVGESLQRTFLGNPFFYGIGISLALLGLVLLYWGWFFTFFAVDPDAVHQRSGFFSKKYRKANLERIQSIDIVRPLLPRLLGLAEISVDVADGSDTALKIQYLKYSDAVTLRTSLLAKVREAKDDGGPPVTEAKVETGFPQPEEAKPRAVEETVLTHLPVGRLVASIFLDVKIWAYVLFSLVTMGILVWATGSFWGAIAANLAVAVMGITAIWGDFNRGYNFRITHDAEGLKINKGLTNATTQSVPTGRIQALEIKQPFLWKKFGWYTVTMNVAGYGLKVEDNGVHRANLMLVATAEELQGVLPLVIAGRWNSGEQEAEQEVSLLQRAIHGTGKSEGFTPVPSSAKWFDPLTFKRNGFGQTPHFLLIRRGLLIRKLTVIPHSCIQSIELRTGPLQKRLGLSTLNLHSVSGQITPRGKNMGYEDAKELLARY